MLTSAFEAEGRVWDLNTKECTAILRGHRKSLTAAKLMCNRATVDEEHRAITCDEEGEIRLWSIFIKEKTSEPYVCPVLQVFEMQNRSYPMCLIKYLAVPNDSKLSTSYYSNIITCSTKLMQFTPEKSSKEFITPTCLLYNDPSGAIITAVGANLLKYDISSGEFLSMFPEIKKKDLTAVALDSARGRRLFIGLADGELLLVNFLSGAIIDRISVHTKDINCIIPYSTHIKKVYTSSLDGKIRLIEEVSGILHLHNTVDNAFGFTELGVPLGVLQIKVTSVSS